MINIKTNEELDKRYLTVDETVEYTTLCKSIIRQWTKRLDFYPAIRIGRRIIIDKILLDKWLSEHSKSGP